MVAIFNISRYRVISFWLIYPLNIFIAMIFSVDSYIHVIMKSDGKEMDVYSMPFVKIIGQTNLPTKILELVKIIIGYLSHNLIPDNNIY